MWRVCNPGIFRTLPYSESWHIQNQRNIGNQKHIENPKLWHIQNPKLWYIRNQRHMQNPGLFRTVGYSESEAYSEPYQTSAMEHCEKQLKAIIIFASYNYFCNISFSCTSSSWNMIFFNAGLIFNTGVYSL